MLGTFIDQFRRSRVSVWDGDSKLLSQTDFNREIARERIRSTRRSIPFCIITFELLGQKHLARRRRVLVRILHRRLRLTDQKAGLDSNRFAALLVDTPEMGGRSALDRLANLCDARNLSVKLSLQVHDPEGFDPDNDRDLPTGSGSRRREDRVESRWMRIDTSIGGPAKAVAFDNPVDAVVSSEGPVVPMPHGRRLVKRCFDVFGASVGLFLSSPIVVCAAIAVKATSTGPAFFKQTREGMGGKPFTIYKLRTMVVDAESKQPELAGSSHRDGPAFKIKHDPRETRVGSFLRRTCIDELPQLINVLRGDMSMVGPRPECIEYMEELEAKVPGYAQRLGLKPGLTGIAQIESGYANDLDSYRRKAAFDFIYLQNCCVSNDLRIMYRTLKVILTGFGAL